MVDTFYFNGENASENAVKFSREFNSKMPFFDNGYNIASKPMGCYSFLLTEVLLAAFDEIKTTLTTQSTFKTNYATK